MGSFIRSIWSREVKTLRWFKTLGYFKFRQDNIRHDSNSLKLNFLSIEIIYLNVQSHNWLYCGKLQLILIFTPQSTTAYMTDEEQGTKTFSSLRWRTEYCVSITVVGKGSLSISDVSSKQCVRLPEQGKNQCTAKMAYEQNADDLLFSQIWDIIESFAPPPCTPLPIVSGQILFNYFIVSILQMSTTSGAKLIFWHSTKGCLDNILYLPVQRKWTLMHVYNDQFGCPSK